LTAILLALGSDYLWKFVGQGRMLAIYANMLATAPLIAILFSLKSDQFAPIDNAIGRFSYPIYLCHEFAVLLLAPHGDHWHDGPWFRPAVVATTLIISALIVYGIDIPIERLRQRIRQRKFEKIPAPDLTVTASH
jgi:peptidoglycan/LPS O-acetylase OafA/YrhL